MTTNRGVKRKKLKQIGVLGKHFLCKHALHIIFSTLEDESITFSYLTYLVPYILNRVEKKKTNKSPTVSR